MAQEVLVPSVGESITEGIIASWEVGDGEHIEQGADLFELETDKTTLQVPAPTTGAVHIIKAAGSEVEIGSVVATIDENVAADTAGAASSAPDATVAHYGTADATTDATVGTIPTDNGKLPQTTHKTTHSTGGDQRNDATVAPTSPSVRRILSDSGLKPQQITGSGPGGRITNTDVQQHSATTANASSASNTTTTADTANISSATNTATAANTTKTEQSTAPISDRQHREPLTKIRKSIAANLMRSRHNAAHLTTFNEVDMTEVQLLRAQYRERFEAVHNIRLGFMSFFVLASCKALLRMPKVNAFLDDDTIVYNDFCNIGVAIAADNGLIVPVLTDAQRKQFADIEKEIKQFAIDAKNKRLMPDALSGGTFTITNGGVFGSLFSTPIPNPPQTAILGMHTIQKRAVVIDDSIQIRPMMYVALTYDHRLIDGKEAVQFLATIKALIEEPAQLMLDI